MRVACSSGCDGVARHEMAEVRTKYSFCRRSGHRMTVHTSCFQKDAPSCRHPRVVDCLPLLLAGPVFKPVVFVHVNPQKHFGVLSAAVLCALAQIDSGFVWIYPGLVYTVRNQIHLAAELRYPEAVISVRGQEGDRCRSGLRCIAEWNVEFVGSDDSQFRITEFPPKLMSYSHYFEGIGRHFGVLNRMDDPRCR